MGICASNKPQAQVSNSTTVLRVDQQATQPTFPQPKYKLGLPNLLEYYQQTPIMQVTDALAYNFLVRMGVNKQKATSSSDLESAFLYSEKCENGQELVDFGFHMFDLTQLDKLVKDQKTFKVLFDFKNLWVFQEYQEQLSKFLTVLLQINVKLKQIYYYQQPIKQLLEQSKMNGQINIINSNFPLLFFDSADIIDQTKRKEDSFKIYLHNSDQLDLLITKKQSGIYQQNLQVRNIVFLYQDVKFDRQKQLETQLYKLNNFAISKNDVFQIQVVIKELIPYLQQLQEMSSNVVLIYSSTEPQGMRMGREAIEQYLSRGQLIHREEVKKYLDMMRSLTIQPPTQIVSQVDQGNSKNSQILPMQIHLSRCEEITNHYKDMLKRLKQIAFLQSCHQTLLKLLCNIIENPTESKFRTIRMSNKVITLNILQYKEGQEIFKLIGFSQNNEEFNNNLEVGMLKLAKGDLELAMKNVIDSVSNNK